ncbi:DUF4202 domain-containing protein [Psychrobium sp. 1_MG-2023]|uniref:DUF4202 domain-containing protein n=1 Tax=Psychrobium sp. 1_MG-2023 TaxID=3062624 RepID=UPI0027352D08|nr:DUF4202 domain-containing protein [Psychrobium sp. 1_MG-2023]MDP2562051.1 DUF4202 domain-containing protein [Psychrobium sp. 1_MG-2023]
MTPSKLEQAFKLIDLANQQDPNRELDSGIEQPKEWLYGLRMSACLKEFEPNASEALQIAARAQHIKRWSIARSQYPLGRKGYNDWRQALGRYHAEEAMGIALQVGYTNEEVAAIGRMLRKEKLKRDPEVQALEDVICLVFLTFYFTDFAAKHSEEKIIRIVQKTWAKMSERGQEEALKLTFTEGQLALLKKALA